MEVKRTFETDRITRDGENPTPPEQWVSPDVAAALSGEVVDFSKHPTPSSKDESTDN